jgi:anti-sigma-K factor RskA
MSLTGKDEILIRRYLLGEMTDREREQVERQLMTDRQYLDHIIKVEESLIDEYVRGELGPDEIGPFETYFLSAPERRY